LVHPWIFRKNDKNVEVRVGGSLIASDAGVLIRAAVDGIGLLYAFPHFVDDLIEQGRLVSVMQCWCRQFDGLYLYYPGGRHPPPQLQAFVDFCKERFKG
jgi:DNA-binding transcriptional LysR family regulator